MKEETDTQEEFTAWVNKEERIVTFRQTEGFEKLTFRTQDSRMMSEAMATASTVDA